MERNADKDFTIIKRGMLKNESRIHLPGAGNQADDFENTQPPYPHLKKRDKGFGLL